MQLDFGDAKCVCVFDFCCLEKKAYSKNMPNDIIFPCDHQDWQPIKAGQGCKCERAACTTQTPLEMYSRRSQTPRLFC